MVILRSAAHTGAGNYSYHAILRLPIVIIMKKIIFKGMSESGVCLNVGVWLDEVSTLITTIENGWGSVIVTVLWISLCLLYSSYLYYIFLAAQMLVKMYFPIAKVSLEKLKRNPPKSKVKYNIGHFARLLLRPVTFLFQWFSVMLLTSVYVHSFTRTNTTYTIVNIVVWALNEIVHPFCFSLDNKFCM